MSKEDEIEKILKKKLCIGDEDGFDEAVSQLLARDKRIATEAAIKELQELDSQKIFPGIQARITALTKELE